MIGHVTINVNGEESPFPSLANLYTLRKILMTTNEADNLEIDFFLPMIRKMLSKRSFIRDVFPIALESVASPRESYLFGGMIRGMERYFG